MVQQNKNNSQVVKMAIVAIATLALFNVSVAVAKELVNTATNEIAEPVNMAERDVLEEIYADLDARATETQSTFILVEHEDKSVSLFTIAYPFEDYAETDLPMVELKGYANIEGAAGTFNGVVDVTERLVN